VSAPSGPTTGATAGHDSDGRAGYSGAEPDIRDVSVGQLLSDVSRDFSTLMRQEVELAKAEIKTEVSKASKGAGMLGGAGFAGYMVVLFVSFAAWWGLAGAMNHIGWAALIVAVVWAVIAAILFVVGRGTLRKVNPKPERTVETVSEVPNALKGH
jgi:putative superfamily III holin-X